MQATSGVVYCHSTFLDGWVQIGIASGRVISVSFPPDEPQSGATEHALLDRVQEYLDEGAPVDFTDVEIALTVDQTDRAILDTVRTIPYGKRWTVEDVIDRTAILTDEDAARSVRSAIGTNPVPLIIPDHRVDTDSSPIHPSIRIALRRREGLT